MIKVEIFTNISNVAMQTAMNTFLTANNIIPFRLKSIEFAISRVGVMVQYSAMIIYV